MAIAVPVERRVVRDGVPALGKLTMWLWAWGLMMLLTLFCRAMFGTAEGLVGWIPFAGRLIKSPIHRIEQKVSHLIGGAVRPIDAHIATQWHTLAQTVRSIPSQLVDDAGLIFGLAAALVVLPSSALVKYLIRVATHPLRAKDALLGRTQAQTAARTKALNKSVAQGVYPRLKVGEYDRTHVLHPGLTTAREQARAAEAQAIATYRWMIKHRTSLLTGVFTGAVAWALTRVGGGWIRCANWRKIGKTVCRMPMSRIDALLGLLAAVFAFAHWDVLLRLSSHIIDETTGEILHSLGLPKLPADRFTIGANEAQFGAPGRPTWPDGRFTIE